MTPEAYERLRSLFDAAVNLPANEQRAFVEASAGSDVPLSTQVMALLKAREDGLFLADPASWRALLLDLDSQHREAQIGNYRVVRELGRGGMGIVYLAVRNDDVFHKIVALKVISGEMVSGASVERFKQERQILASLDHPNIARILDGGDTPDHRPFYVMEHVDGVPIDEYCNRLRADVVQRVRLFLQVCEAVAYLHDQAIVHRDLKPSNILVTSDGRVKLLDFGIAKSHTLEGLLASPSVPGRPTLAITPGYSSPEQIEGREVSASTDIYSLGVVLYELLTGRQPFAGDDRTLDLTALLGGGDPPAPSTGLRDLHDRTAQSPVEFRRQVSGDLDRIILTALKRAPASRYPTVRLFDEDLRGYLEGGPGAARVLPRSTPRSSEPVERKKTTMALAALVVVILGLAAWLTVQHQRAAAEVQAQELSAEQSVALLNARVAGWGAGPNAVPESQKLADVQWANQILATDLLHLLSLRGADPGRLARLLAAMQRFLDAADQSARDEPAVRKTIATAYNRVGDLQANPRMSQVTGVPQALASYRRAADVAASVAPSEPSWTEAELSQLAVRARQLGSQLDVPHVNPNRQGGQSVNPSVTSTPSGRQAQRPATRPPSAASAQPDRSGSAPAPSPESGRKDDPARRSELTDQLNRTSAKAEEARRNLKALSDRLAGQGKRVRTDLTTSMAQVDTLLQEAREDLGRNDFATGEDHLRRANYELQKVLQDVGRDDVPMVRRTGANP
jgi:serine/threonine protein kinase